MFKSRRARSDVHLMSSARPVLARGKARNDNAQDSLIEDWDEYFSEIARTVARKSKDPRCRVGAILVSTDRVVLTTGFNGLARGVYDDPRILGRVAEKLKWICHAESNAIFNAARLGACLDGTIMYVTKFPCFACCNAIVQTGVKRICTPDTRYWDDDPFDRQHKRKPVILRQAGVEVTAPNHPDYRQPKKKLLAAG
jgi:dCMP deaminase